MGVARTIALFVVAAVAEIGGAWLIWQGVREHRGIPWIGAGVAALAAFVATLQEDADELERKLIGQRTRNDRRTYLWLADGWTSAWVVLR